MSCYPKHFDDDGTTVAVDLHGCTVDDALRVAQQVFKEASRRGRSRVELIHGSSTSRSSARTIKNELLARLDRGEYGEWVSGHRTVAAGGTTVLWIRMGANSNPSRIRIRDVVPH